MSFRFFAVAAAVTVAGISGASASTVTLEKEAADLFGGGGKQTVSFSNRSGQFLAGGFRLTDSVSNFIAWCLDVSHNLGLPSDYSITDTPFATSVALSDTQKNQIEDLFEVNYASTSDLLTDNAKSAGFQLALWEIVYEDPNNGFNVDGGNDAEKGDWYAKNPTTSDAISWANTFLGNLGGEISQSFELTFYESEEGGQNLVTVTPVPLPAAGLMLGLGLAGLYGAGRRRGKARA